MTATLSPQQFCENLMVTARLTIEARALRKGDYLPFARRVVVDIEVDEWGRLDVSTQCPALTGPVWRHRWGPATPVIIAPRDE